MSISRLRRLIIIFSICCACILVVGSITTAPLMTNANAQKQVNSVNQPGDLQSPGPLYQQESNNTTNQRGSTSDIVITSLKANRTSAPENGHIEMTLFVENKGQITGSRTITIQSFGDTANRSVTLQPDESKRLSWVVSYPRAGNYFVRAGNKSVQLSIGSPPGSGSESSDSSTVQTGNGSGSARTSFDIVTFQSTNTTVEVGESVTITAIIENTGDVRGTHTVELRENGEVTKTQEVDLNPGASSNVTFDVSYGSPGTYQATVGDQQLVIEVQRSLNREQGISVGTVTNGTSGPTTNMETGNSSGASGGGSQPVSGDSSQQDVSGSGSAGGLKWFLIGLGSIALVLAIFIVMETYANLFWDSSQ